MKTRLTVLLFLCTCALGKNLQAQNPTIIRYINTYKFAAIEEMKRTGVPASIKLAQGILETQAGESDLVRRSNNHFGIKCKTAWVGPKVYHDDDERGECFRAYASAMESYKDHSDFLKNSQRYAFLFQVNPEDYKGWAVGLKKAGYATNPKYWQQLVKYIEDYDLNLYTQVALGKKQITDELPMYASVAADSPVQVLPAVVTNVVVIDEDGMGNNQAVEAPPANYPGDVFEINNTKVVFVKAGSSLLAIADEHNIRFKQLLDFNDLPEDADLVEKDQLVFLQRKRKQGTADFTVLYRNESLYDVAQREGIRMDELLAYNFLEKTQLPQPGRKLFLKKDLATNSIQQNNEVQYVVAQNQNNDAVKTAEATGSKQVTKHTVQAKETLYSIARKYHVGMDQIRDWNKLDNNELRVGQQLLIYKN